MKNQITTIVLMLAIFISGCSGLRSTALELSVENIENAEAVREISSNCISVWPVQSGFIKGVLGDRINELPKETIEAIQELDRLAEQTERTDHELGIFLGTKIRILKFIIQAAIERYVPDVVEILPIIF